MTGSPETFLVQPIHPLHPFHEKPFLLVNSKESTELTFKCVESAFLACCFKGLEVQKIFQELSGEAARDRYEQITLKNAKWAAESPYGLRDDLAQLSPSGLSAPAIILSRLVRLKFARDDRFRELVMMGSKLTYRIEPVKKKLKPWPSDMWWLYCITEMRIREENRWSHSPPLGDVAAAP